MTRALAASAVAAAVTLLALAACSGTDGAGGTVSVREWVEDSCDAALAWRRDLDEAGLDVRRDLIAAETPASARTTLQGFLSDAEARTDQLLGELEEAGVPEGARGRAVARALRAGFEDARDVFADMERAADDLPLDDLGSFRAEVARISERLDMRIEAIRNPFLAVSDRYGSEGGLGQAVRETASCRAFARGD